MSYRLLVKKKNLIKAQQNYSVSEQECLTAIVFLKNSWHTLRVMDGPRTTLRSNG